MPISNWASEALDRSKASTACTLKSDSHARSGSGFIEGDAGAEDGVSRASAVRQAFPHAPECREIFIRQAQLTPQPSQRIA
jgi:hypothetical protein